MIFFSCTVFNLKSLWAGQLPCLHHIVERPDGIRQIVKEKFFFHAIITPKA